MLRGHAVAHWHTGILPTGLLLLLLDVLVISHLLLLFVGHVAGVHSGGTGHVGLLSSIDVAVADILGGLRRDLGGVDTILAGGWIGSVEASLVGRVSTRHDGETAGMHGRETHLNQVLTLGLGDQWLKLGSGEGVDQAGLGHDQKQHLGTREDGQFICLRDRKSQQQNPK